MQDVINFVTSNWTQIVEAILAFLGFAAIIAQFTSNKSDDEWVQRIYDWINILGMNNGKAKNDPKIK